MAFLGSLQSSGQQLGGGYFGQPSANSDSASDVVNGMMPLFNQVRNRNLMDFAAKTRIAGDESIRQAHLMKVFDPTEGGRIPGNSNGSQNVVYKPSPADEERAKATEPITPFQQAGLNIEKAKVQQSGQMGEERQNLNEKQYELATQKNENIKDQKEHELQQKADDASRRLQLAYDQLQQKSGDAIATGQYHQAQLDAQKAKSELDLAQRDRQLAETTANHKAVIAQRDKALDAAGYQVRETPDPNFPNDPTKTVTTILKKGIANVPTDKSDPLGIRPAGK